MAAESWLDDAAWAAIEPLPPRSQPGAGCVDDRRVISGIEDFGPIATRYDRLARNFASAVGLVAAIIGWT